MDGLPVASLITHLADLGDASLASLDTLEITGDAYRHLFRARRLARGARLRVVDGAGGARWGEVVEIDRRRAAIRLDEPAPNHESALHLELLVGALKPERASWLVEKATELGVAAIRFLATERTPRNYGDAQLDRWRRVAASAVEQSHRAALPQITGIHPWNEIPPLLARSEQIHVLQVSPLDDGEGGGSDGPPAGGLRELAELKHTPAVLGGPSEPPPSLQHQAALIGPEGGFTDQEIATLQGLGAIPLDLGPRVLRVETAAVAIAALLLCNTNSSHPPRQTMGE